MERVLSVEEKIRRAEEIYERRRMGETRQLAKVAVNSKPNKKDIKLLKKMLIQLLVCVAIYMIIYTIQHNEYVFSKDFTNKVNEILSYDTNFVEIYETIKNQAMQLFNQEASNEETQQNEQQPEEQQPQEQDGIGGAAEEGKESEEQVQAQEENKELSQEEKDVMAVKNTTSFIKPVEGIISSKFGYREEATGNVPKDHTGTDIAANTGTKVISATEGEVVLASDKGDYRKPY